jgi:hypothetical protein
LSTIPSNTKEIADTVSAGGGAAASTNKTKRRRLRRRRNMSSSSTESKGNQESPSVEKKETLSMGDINQHQVDTNTHLSVETNISEFMEVANDIQQWFSELSVEKRASALGFADRSVLSVFLEHASLSSSSSTSSPFPEKRVTDKQGQYGVYVNIIFQSLWTISILPEKFHVAEHDRA